MVENRLQYCQLFWFLCDFCRTCFFLKHYFLRVLWLHMNHSFHLKHKWVSTSYQQQRKWDPPEESKSGNDKKGPNTYWLKQYEFFRVFLGLFLLFLHIFFFSLVGSGEPCFYSFAFEYLLKLWPCWPEFPSSPGFILFPFSLLNPHTWCRLSSTSWASANKLGTLFPPWAHPGPFTQQDAVSKRRVGMWI